MWRSNTAGTAIVISSDDSDSEELPAFKFARYIIWHQCKFCCQIEYYYHYSLSQGTTGLAVRAPTNLTVLVAQTGMKTTTTWSRLILRTVQ